MRFSVIEQNQENGSAWQCRLLAVSESGYHAWAKRASTMSKTKAQDEVLVSKVKAIFSEHKGNYGCPRVHDALHKQSVACSRKRVSRLMRENGLRAKCSRKKPRTTQSKHSEPIAPNIVDRDFLPLAPNKIWAGDISYIHTRDGVSYIAVTLDLFSRRVIGFCVDTHMETSLCLESLQQGVMTRRPNPGCVHHSDRGSQYASALYRNEAQSLGMVMSMSRKGNCWDNAAVESFFATLKREIDMNTATHTREEVVAEVTEYISYYNHRRSHSTLGYKSPVEFELDYQTTLSKKTA